MSDYNFTRLKREEPAFYKSIFEEHTKEHSQEQSNKLYDIIKKSKYEHQKKLEAIANSLKRPVEEIKFMDEGLRETEARIIERQHLPENCYVLPDLERYWKNMTTPKENESMYKHCKGCGECLRRLFLTDIDGKTLFA